MQSRFTAIASAISDKDARTVSVLMTDDSGELHQLEFAEGILGALILAIVTQNKLLRDREARVVSEFQTMALTPVRSVNLAGGQAGLILTFENVIEVAASMSPSVYDQLRTELDASGVELGRQR